MRDLRRFDREIIDLYAENDLPSDRLFKDHEALVGFTQEFNNRTGGAFEPKAIADEIERIRKDKARTGGLPKLGRHYRGPKYRR